MLVADSGPLSVFKINKIVVQIELYLQWPTSRKS